jgi:DNA-binding NtrC family response regulator
MTYAFAVRQFQREYCAAVLLRNHGNVSAAAAEAGIHRNTFGRIMAQAGVNLLAIRKHVRKANGGRLKWRR